MRSQPQLLPAPRRHRPGASQEFLQEPRGPGWKVSGCSIQWDSWLRWWPPCPWSSEAFAVLAGRSLSCRGHLLPPSWVSCWTPPSPRHRATKPGCDTGDESIRSTFLPVGHPQGALHRRGCHRRLVRAAWFSSPGWFGSRSHQRREQEHPLYLPEWIRARLLQPAGRQLSCQGGTGQRSLLCLPT